MRLSFFEAAVLLAVHKNPNESLCHHNIYIIVAILFSLLLCINYLSPSLNPLLTVLPSWCCSFSCRQLSVCLCAVLMW